MDHHWGLCNEWDWDLRKKRWYENVQAVFCQYDGAEADIQHQLFGKKFNARELERIGFVKYAKSN